MQPAGPSTTAIRVALRRAAHQIYDARPFILDDPLAVAILGPKLLPELAKTATRLESPASIGLRAHLVARSRFAEDTLAASRVPQYVLLGAGLDTFAHRNPHPGLRIFEVDHPATQQWKRDRVRAAALPEPAGLTYVPVDFETQSLAAELAAAGHDTTRSTCFSWLGVVPYLTLDAFRATVAFIAGQPPGSSVVFDYGQPRAALPPTEQLERDSLSARVHQAGEPFQLFFTPAEVAAELRAFRTLEDLGSPEINARFFSGRTDELRTRGTGARLLAAHL